MDRGGFSARHCPSYRNVGHRIESRRVPNLKHPWRLPSRYRASKASHVSGRQCAVICLQSHFCLFRKLGGSGDCGPASSPYPCLISRNAALPLERALSSNGKRPNSTCGPSCPRLSSIACHADHDPPALTASLKGLPALKVATVEAEISKVSPILGLRPVRAGRLLVPNVPKPERLTASPRASEAAIPDSMELTVASASGLVNPVSPTIRRTRSDLFTRALPGSSCNPDRQSSRGSTITRPRPRRTT